MLIVTEQQMKEIEQASMKFDLTMTRLMENAGSAAAAFIRRTFPVEGLNCMIFCGRGNNGGDGFVVARRLREHGANAVVVLVQGEPRTPQAKQMFDSLVIPKIPVISLDQEQLIREYLTQTDIIVDAIYGTGFHGSLAGQSLTACELISEANAPVLSLDIPSGLTCDRGTAAYGSIQADYTVVFQLLKPLHMLPSALAYCGEVQVVDIGIPEEAYRHVESHFQTTSAEQVWQALPERKADSHKGSYGRVLAICGSSSFRGAATLAASGVLRVGAGLCVIAAPEPICAAVANRLPEAILQPLPCNQWGDLDFDAARPLLEKQINQADIILFGCGCGTEQSTLDILEFLLRSTRIPLVLDADALTLLGERTHLLGLTKQPVILTPHPGEMATLAATSTVWVQANRLDTAISFAEKHGVYVVLKGHRTLIALPDGRLYTNETGNAGLAKGGSGDILAGMIAGLLAQKMPSEQACACAVWLHGAAADRCAKRLSMQGMLPSDLLDDLCQLFLEQGL